MEIKFDSHLDYQLDAIRPVVDVFTGQPLNRASLNDSRMRWAASY